MTKKPPPRKKQMLLLLLLSLPLLLALSVAILDNRMTK
jgi:hypothetical protein